MGHRLRFARKSLRFPIFKCWQYNVVSCLRDDTYKRTLAANRKEQPVSSLAI